MAISKKPEIGKLKNILEENFEITESPNSEDEVIVVRELIAGKSYTVEVGIGKCWKYPGYWDVVGHIYEEQRDKFIDGNIRVEKRLPKSVKVICAISDPGLFERVDKAALGFSDDEWDGKLEAFLKIIEDWIKKD
ncbi:MAG: hypothetical protein GF364_15800 [Candidatus Lokiarchaeota archaeon]|nr:hypothetical protein [Candidatus Lokiarchaeota archaeon]